MSLFLFDILWFLQINLPGKKHNISNDLSLSPVVSKNLLLHFCDEVTLCARVLPLSSANILVESDLFLGLDVRGGPLQVDQGMAGFVVLQQDVDVGGGERTLVTQVGDAWDQKNQGQEN